MKIAGLYNMHDCAFAVLEDGVPIVHNELERFTRVKMSPGDVVEFMMDEYPDWEDIDHFCLITGEKPHEKLIEERRTPDGKTFPNELENWKNLVKHVITRNHNNPSKPPGGIFFMGHHHAHAAHAFYSSNFDDALIFTIDGGGWDIFDHSSHEFGCSRGPTDVRSTAFTVYYGRKNLIRRIYQGCPDSQNIGTTWARVTKDCFGLSNGYPKGGQEGTVMGMAALGDHSRFYKHFGLTGFFDQEWEALGLSNGYNRENEQDRFDLAAGLQFSTQETLKHWMGPFIEYFQPKNVCIAGGVALNSVAMGNFYNVFGHIVENFYVPPVPYDAGHALGAAQFVYHYEFNRPRVKWEDNFTPYLGRTYTEEEVLAACEARSSEINVTRTNDDAVLDLLADTKIVSVFGGGSESGRRALGNRSILADPRKAEIKDIINAKVKHRQWFRPFAPSILREEVKNWFKIDKQSPYMGFVLPFKDEVKDQVPAVVHFDGSARLQTVTESDNHWYYNFIKKWQTKSGVPILLNTSFNDREPIVEKPEHALDCFLRTELDNLYFFDYGILISKA